MSDRHERQLRERVEARHGPLHEQKAPKTADEAAELARTDPDKFSALWEAGRVGPRVLGAREEDR